MNKVKDEYPDNLYGDIKLMRRLLIPIFIGFLFFLAALSYNSSITSTIYYWFGERTGLIPTSTEVIAEWVYTGIITIILLVFVFIFKDTLKKSQLHIETHREGAVYEGGAYEGGVDVFEGGVEAV